MTEEGKRYVAYVLSFATVAQAIALQDVNAGCVTCQQHMLSAVLTENTCLSYTDTDNRHCWRRSGSQRKGKAWPAFSKAIITVRSDLARGR